MSMPASYTPHIGVEGLGEAAYGALGEEHEPREAGIAGEGTRRPVGAGRRHIYKWVVGWEGRRVIIVH